MAASDPEKGKLELVHSMNEDAKEAKAPVRPQLNTSAMPADVAKLLDDREFMSLPMNDRLDAMGRVDPQFGKWRAANPKDATKWMESQAESRDPDALSSFEGGFQSSMGQLQLYAANAAMILEELGLENDYDESWRKAGEANMITGGLKVGSDWYDFLASIAGGIPGYIAVPGAMTLAAGVGISASAAAAPFAPFVAPIVGFGLAGALRDADEGPGEAAKSALIDASLGAIYPVTAHMGRGSRMLIESAAAYAVSEQPDQQARITEALAIGLLAGSPARTSPDAVMKRLVARYPKLEPYVKDIPARIKEETRKAERVAWANTYSRIRRLNDDARPKDITHFPDGRRATSLREMLDAKQDWEKFAPRTVMQHADGTPIGPRFKRDESGKVIKQEMTGLESAHQALIEFHRGMHPMSTMGTERPMNEVVALATRKQRMAIDTRRPRSSLKETGQQSQTFEPGDLFEDARPMELDEDLVAGMHGQDPEVPRKFKSEEDMDDYLDYADETEWEAELLEEMDPDDPWSGVADPEARDIDKILEEGEGAGSGDLHQTDKPPDIAAARKKRREEAGDGEPPIPEEPLPWWKMPFRKPREWKGFLRAGEITEPFARVWNMAIHKGLGDDMGRLPKTRGRREVVQGWYIKELREPHERGKPGPEAVRQHFDKHPAGGLPGEMHVKDPFNIVTAAHEMGHGIMDLDDFLNPYEMGGAKWVEAIESIGRAGETHGIFADFNEDLTIKSMMEMYARGLVPDDAKWLPELHRISYDRADVSEGWAEFFKHFLTNDKRLGGNFDLDQVPALKALVEDQWLPQLDRKKRRETMRFRQRAHRYMDQSHEAAFKSKIGPDKNAALVMHSAWSEWRQQNLDDFEGIANMERQVFGRILPGGVYEQFRLLRGIGEAAEHLMRYGAPKWIQDGDTGVRMAQFSGEGLPQLFAKRGFKTRKQIDAALEYSVARQAQELKGQALFKGKLRELADLDEADREWIEMMNETREKLFTDSQIAAILKRADDNDNYALLHEDLKDFANRMVDFAEGAGLVNKKQRESWKRKEFTMSLMREVENRARYGQQRNAALVSHEAFTTTLRGSNRQLRDPLQNLIETHARTYRLSMENIAKQKLLETISDTHLGFTSRRTVWDDAADMGIRPTLRGGRFGEIIHERSKIENVKVNDLKKALVIKLREEFPSTYNDTKRGRRNIARALRRFKTPKGIDSLSLKLGADAPWGPDIITVRVNGEPVYIKGLDPLVTRAVGMMRRPALTGFQSLANQIRKFKQKFITLGPGFIAANFVRDVAMASVMSKTGHFHLHKSIGGLKSAIFRDQHYLDYIANGGGAAGVHETFASQRNRLIRHAQRTGFDPKRLLLDGVSVHRFMGELSRSMEMASRLGEFKAARMQGKRATHAAYMAREVSTDFGMRGDGRMMNFAANAVPFFNAMVQGTDRFYRGLAADPTHRSSTALKTGVLGLASAALYLYNRDIPEYQDEPDWSRWSYWHFYLPVWDEEGNQKRYGPEHGRLAGQKMHDHWKLPKLWEVGLLGTLAEESMQSLLGDDDEDVIDLVHDGMQLLAGNFGVNLFERGFPLPVPAFAEPVVEQFSGKLLFTGNPIEDQAIANRQHWARANPHQSKTWYKYGEIMRDFPVPDSFLKSPSRAEAFVRGWFAEYATLGAWMIDQFIDGEAPAKNIDDYPVVSRFRQRPGKYSRQDEEFWEGAKQVRMAYDTMNAMAGNPRYNDGDFQRWVQDPENLRGLALRRAYNDGKKKVREIANMISRIQNGYGNFTPRERTDKINELRAKQRQIMSAVNNVGSQVEKRFQ